MMTVSNDEVDGVGDCVDNGAADDHDKTQTSSPGSGRPGCALQGI